jgi:nicotinamide riboside kinase
MRLALSGASCTGKSTIASLLAERFPSLMRVNTDGRAILSRLGFGGIDLLSPQQYITFQKLYIEEKLQLESHKNDFVTDRSTIDCLAYWNLACKGDSDVQENHQIELRCLGHVSVYDTIIYFPFGIVPYQDDGWRGADVSFHERMDEELRRLYTTHTIPVYRLLSVDPIERCEEIQAIIWNLD